MIANIFGAKHVSPALEAALGKAMLTFERAQGHKPKPVDNFKQQKEAKKVAGPVHKKIAARRRAVAALRAARLDKIAIAKALECSVCTVRHDLKHLRKRTTKHRGEA